MSVKGTVDTKIDTTALNEIIVFGNMYKNEVDTLSADVIAICRRMEEEESLKGGDGDVIRESFASIAKGMNGIQKSACFIAKSLDEKLVKALQMKRGTTIGSSQDDMAAATKKAGVLKKE